MYMGNSKCRYCDTPVKAVITEGSPIAKMEKHKFVKAAIKFNDTIEVTYQCYNCGKEDSLILNKVL